MTAVILHLSDIHIKSTSDWIIDKSELIASSIYANLPEASVVFVVVSGDIAWAGKKEEYAASKNFLNAIKAYVRKERDVPVHFLLAPGNHDCDFSLNSTTRTLTLNAVRSNPQGIDDSVIETGCVVQAPFVAFAAELHTEDETRVGDSLWTAHRFTVEGKEIVFDTVNVSWCSQIKEEPGTLVFPHTRYATYLEQTPDLRIGVIHHPLNWFSQAMYHPFKQFLRSLSNVLISGHEHVGGVGEDLNATSGHSAYVEGCVLQDAKRPTTSSFNVIELDLAEGSYRATRFLWDITDKHYSATEEGSWSDFRTLPKKALNRFEITEEFQQLISDPGAAFQTTSGSLIKLADLYVYPDMQEPLEKPDTKRILSTSLLQDVSRLTGGVLLSGEEKVGASSLLYMMFRHFYDQGLLPLYVRGADIKAATERNIDAAIENAVSEQYGPESVEIFKQASKSKKILFLDDFDDGPVKGGLYRARILKAVNSRFQYFLVTASELFDFKTTVVPHGEGKISDIKEYKLLPFGYTLRANLVKRWLQRTVDDGSLDEATLLARLDQAERMLDSVMARNIVPALPLYLLTLLQSIDAGVSGGFEESGLGEYYDFLIKEGFKSAGIPKKDWGKMIEYCSHLAWLMHATEHKEVSSDELKAFTERYSKEENTVVFESRRRELVESMVLSSSGDYYRFRYHYVYYFLKGRFLSSKLDDLVVLAHVRECCAHLYVRENANTVLFLAHHAFNNPVFLDCIVQAASTPFGGEIPVNFRGGDLALLTDFVTDLKLPPLKYNGESPETMRERENQRRDRMDDGTDGLTESKEDGAESKFAPQMISLFKTVEILGQILKNQIANVNRNRRVELLQILMKGPLRALRAYFALFVKDKEQAQLELVELLKKRKVFDTEEQRLEAARKLLAHLMQYTSFGFILKAISSISSDELQADIESAAKAIDTPAARLISVGVRLDSPKEFPRSEMRNLLAEVKPDFIAMRVLQMLTLRRLYMFRTSERDKQWLDSQEVLGIKMQHAVDARTRSTKLLKS